MEKILNYNRYNEKMFSFLKKDEMSKSILNFLNNEDYIDIIKEEDIPISVSYVFYMNSHSSIIEIAKFKRNILLLVNNKSLNTSFIIKNKIFNLCEKIYNTRRFRYV